MFLCHSCAMGVRVWIVVDKRLVYGICPALSIYRLPADVACLDTDAELKERISLVHRIVTNATIFLATSITFSRVFHAIQTCC